MSDFVDEIEVVRYYVKCEIGKVVSIHEQKKVFVKNFNNAIDAFDSEEIIKLAKALSGKEYRDNPFYRCLIKPYRWKVQDVSIDLLILPEIKETVNQILDKFDFKLAKFVQHLKNGGGRNPVLREFRNDNRKIGHEMIIVESSSASIKILDGAHRAVVLALKGRKKMRCYLGKAE